MSVFCQLLYLPAIVSIPLIASPNRPSCHVAVIFRGHIGSRIPNIEPCFLDTIALQFGYCRSIPCQLSYFNVQFFPNFVPPKIVVDSCIPSVGGSCLVPLTPACPLSLPVNTKPWPPFVCAYHHLTVPYLVYGECHVCRPAVFRVALAAMRCNQPHAV